MKRFEVMAKALAGATGRSETDLRQMFLIFNHSRPSPQMMEEMPETEAEELLAKLGGEKAGILAWLEEGARRAADDPRRVLEIERKWNARN